ncbi:phage tail tape measure protein [Streptococcus dysgalactiae]|uniref:phage tail tape measure protein n=1 Tax=Streptococcus dysgalactiae TaxID=1334 RepID=UPI003530B1F5
MGNIGDLVATATLDISPFMSNTRNLKTYMKGLDNSLKAVENSFRGHGGRIKGLKAVYTETGSALKGYQDLLKTQSQKYSDLKREIGDVNNATAEQKQKLIGAKSAMLETAAQVTELQNRLRALATETSVFTRFGKAAERIGGKMKSFGDSVAGVGAAFTRGVTAPIVAGAGYAIKAAVDYESAFAGVKKTVDETATVSYAKLSQGIRQMAKELPASAVEIAHVAEAAGQLGVKTGDILSFSRTMIDLGESTNLSAEEAATSIAKIANITGLASSEYSRFGSAVVALGNNFATTEKDIVAMTNRIAASGKLAGLTNQEMLALATAMSSVGIEAEAGGTAMTQSLSAIERAVASGGDNLNKFAQIANMSSADFARAWKEKPIVALQEFIKGLGQLDKKGESATKVLDELGLSGIRQSNMLKSLGLASETLGKALDTSNKAWQENTALTNEANKRYETTESKLKMLKNEINDVAIEFGGPLVDALRNGLEAGKPIIQMAADLAKQFNSLDKEQQQQIVKWGLIAAAAGPVLSILGNGFSVIGGTIQALSKMGRGLGALSGWLRTFKAGAVAASAGAEAAATSMGGMAGAVALLSNPVTWGVLLGGAAIVGIGLIADSMYKAQKRTEEWGTAVSQTEAVALSNFKKKVDETNTSLQMFEAGASSVKKVTEAFDDLVGSIEKLAQSKLDKNINLAKKLGLSEETINVLKSKTEAVVNNVKGMNAQIKAIMEKHNGDMSKLSETEKELVLRNQREMISTQLDLMKFSASEKKALTAALNNELDALNARQLEKVSENTVKMLDKENSAFKTKKAELKEILKQFGSDTSKLSAEELAARQEVLNRLTELNMQHNLKTKALSDQYLAIQRERVQRLKESGKSQEEIHRGISQMASDMAQKLGISYDDAYRKLAYYTEKSGETLKVLSRNTANATAEVAAANAQWDSLFTSDNPQQSLNELLSTAEGWNSFEIMVKNADVEPTGRAALAEMLVAGGQWQTMTLEQKKLVVDGQQAMIEIFDSKELLAQWQALTPEEKVLLAKNLTQEPTMSAQQAIDSVKQTVPADVNATDKTAGDTQSAQSKIDNVKQKTPADVKASDKTGPDVASANRAVNSPKQNSPAVIRAQDNASGVAENVIWSLARIPRSVTTTITTFVRKIFGHEKGTDFHPGGLAMVNDQKGPLYRELVTLPTGESFIPSGRNVILPLPRGSKVLKASRTKQLFPHYANGIGFDDTKIASLTTRLKSVQDKGQVIVNTDPQLAELIKLLKDRDDRNVTNNYTVNATNSGNSDSMFSQENMRRLIRELAYYANGEGGRLA